MSGAETGSFARDKTFRDTVYGYITVNEDIVHNIIDTAAFQRLRDIRQTSYEPLYPASLHNRFVHSMGVYFLGQMAFDALKSSAQQHAQTKEEPLNTIDALLSEDEWTRCRCLFELACLLHDIGHAPFSHTGEDCYKESKSDVAIHIREEAYQKQIEEALSAGESRTIQEDLKDKQYNYLWHLYQMTNDPVFVSNAAEDPAAHEIMSCIVALETFATGADKKYFKTDGEKSFFARCITGLTYIREDKRGSLDFEKMTEDEYNTVKKKMLMDCIIQLLHSSVIDVDRLDYIIRDASTMGYQSVSVDYQRLLKGIVLVREGNFAFNVGFHKNAVSVIENAVYAHDNERKWVQSHPTILYESYLIQQSIQAIEQRLQSHYVSKSTLLSFDSLTEKGSRFLPLKEEGTSAGLHIRYLSDSDLLYLMKNVFFQRDSYFEEYFYRNMRRHPVWKSEAEYRSLFDEGARSTLIKAMEMILADTRTTGIRINRELLDKITEEIERGKQEKRTNYVKVSEKRKRYCQKILEIFSGYGVKEEIVLLSTSFFKSNFVKGRVQKLMILFPGQPEPFALDRVSSTLSGRDDSEKFFYLFYYLREQNKRVPVKEIADALLQAFTQIS